jgi:hypothetical protein
VKDEGEGKLVIRLIGFIKEKGKGKKMFNCPEVSGLLNCLGGKGVRSTKYNEPSKGGWRNFEG